jgi:predicted ATPase
MHSAGGSGSPFNAAPILVGRAREQVFLREELVTATGGRGRLVLIGGEAGIGKTTLARDLEREASGRGVQVLTGHCYDLTNTPPYGPWLDLVAGGRPSGGPAPPAAFAGGRLSGTITNQAALFAEVHDFFAGVAAAGPTLVVLEDLHWADPASIELLRYLAARVGSLPLLVVATYRIDELTRRHPFYQQLPALIREADALRLDLRRLATSDLQALIAGQWSLAAAVLISPRGTCSVSRPTCGGSWCNPETAATRPPARSTTA